MQRMPSRAMFSSQPCAIICAMRRLQRHRSTPHSDDVKRARQIRDAFAERETLKLAWCSRGGINLTDDCYLMEGLQLYVNHPQTPCPLKAAIATFLENR